MIGLTLLLVGLALLCWGASATYGLLSEPTRTATTDPTTSHQASSSNGASNVVVRVDALGHHVPVATRVPGLPVATAIGQHELDTGALPLPARVELDVTQPNAAPPSSASAQSTTVESVHQSLVLPPAGAVALGAAAAAGAGLLVYFWGGVKAWAGRALVVPAIGLYARLSRAEVFENGVRERIFDSIRTRPGISASDLAKAAGVSWGTTIYHLEVLEQNRMVTSLRKGRHRRYFENGAQLDASKDVVALLQNPVTATVAQTVRASPGATQKDLAHATGMSPQALHWHLVRLCQAGLVRKQREGRFVRHFALGGGSGEPA